MATITVSSTLLSRRFSEYLAGVRYRGDTVIVLKNNAAVAELTPLPAERCTLREFLSLWREGPADPTLADDLETVGTADTPPSNPWD
jgi:antitoxin (DNA-binding transcriptional repressor) of toxin-antitoxin stability system